MSEKSTDPLFLPQLPRVKASTELSNLRALFLQLMQQETSWKPDTFPGSQPVSFERKHLGAGSDGGKISLQTMGFYAAEKTDGMRYMLMILGSRGAYAVDRKFEFIRLPAMYFPRRGADGQPDAGDALLDDTILDGELVVDTRRKGTEEGTIEKVKELRYLCYDACAVGGICLMDKALPLRLMSLRRDVLAPRYDAQIAGHDFSLEPFGVDQKDFFSISHLPALFSHVKPGTHDSEHLYSYQDPLRKIEHGNDGVIFTPIMSPYQCGTCPAMLKWKPSNMNSIDFQLHTEWRRDGAKGGSLTPRFSILYATSGSLSDARYDWLTLDDEMHKRFVRDPKADQRIIECVYDPEHETIVSRALLPRPNSTASYAPANHQLEVTVLLVEEQVAKAHLHPAPPLITCPAHGHGGTLSVPFSRANCSLDPRVAPAQVYTDNDDTWDYPKLRKGGWKYERMREDKELPNDIRTVQSVEKSAQDGVQMDELLDAMRRR